TTCSAVKFTAATTFSLCSQPVTTPFRLCIFTRATFCPDATFTPGITLSPALLKSNCTHIIAAAQAAAITAFPVFHHGGR
ncbi:hypothetical protein NFB42_16650, partial [Yersinia ruckeri]|uniref:hypothetical protein n=1 Tax=Yersinia ruckeri TaxID=29486 RepID=UPI002237CCAF